MDNEGDIRLKDIEEQDCERLAEVFLTKGYDESMHLYQTYLSDATVGIKDVILACSLDEIVGYVVINWQSSYEDFKEEGIPEIQDIQVLSNWRRKGIATKLMDEAEKRATNKANYCAVGVGLSEAYEALQNLYEKRNYLPDGKGIFYIQPMVIQNDQLEVYDNQALMMIKHLSLHEAT